MRADLLLVARGLTSSRTAARRAIEAGRLFWFRGAERLAVKQPAQDLPDSAELELLPDESERYVSRGGLKLAGALAHTGLDVAGMVCLDVGQSTGGFTDCLLQAGAARVVGVEVGHDQLHPRMRDDPRVVCIEGVNARGLAGLTLPSPPGTSPQGAGREVAAVRSEARDGPQAHRGIEGEGATVAGMQPGFPHPNPLPEGEGEHPHFDLIVCDASFISLTLLLPNFAPLLKPEGRVIALVKPQFEVGPENIGKGGIVRDPALYPAVEAKIRAACAVVGLAVLDFFASPITGGDGNREFFVYARRG